MDGRLRLCSLSLVFEPNDWSRGIIRCPFKYMDGPPALSEEKDTVVIKCSRHFVMKTGNVIAPFDTIEQITVFRFSFLHSSPQLFLKIAQLVFNDGQLANASLSSSTTTNPNIVPFDASNFIDVREKAMTTNLRCFLLTPLLSTPGCLLVTDSYIYFQPSTTGIIASTATIANTTTTTTTVAPKATSWALKSITGYARRYNGLKDSALELYLLDPVRSGSSSTSVLLALETPADRERVMRCLPHHVPCHTDREFVVAAFQEWTTGRISNYEYLLALNSAAGRTFQDLSRYPVFPWILQDYNSSKLDWTSSSTYRDLSKPVGALDSKRLEYFQTRYESMQQDMTHPFLYGTHYSAPGYVLYYLVRSMPEHMLCLQNGKFDSADRMFHSLEHSYASVLTNHADVKELIPEFFDTESNAGFDFLINARNLNLGVTQTGERVHDVLLPPWATSPRDFIRKNRKALDESDYVTQNLPKWIDLIFGAKSRGEKAKKANNLFHQMAYLGPADINRMASAQERAQAELQATEFGIVPDQLFSCEHPMKQYLQTNSDKVVSGDDIVVVNLNRRDDFLDMSYDYIANADTPPTYNNKTAEQPWELLDSPSKSLKSFDEEDDANNRDRGWSLDSFGVGIKSLQHTNISPFASTEQKSADKTPHSKSSWLSRNLARRKFSGDNEVLNTESDIVKEDVCIVYGEDQQVATNMDGSSPILRRLTSKDVHNDAVNACALIYDRNGELNLITASHDGSLIIQTVESNDLHVTTSTQPQSALRKLSRGLSRTANRALPVDPHQQDIVKLVPFRSHSNRDPVACMAIASYSNEGRLIFTGGHDDSIVVYGLNSSCALASIHSHRDAVTGLHVLPIRLKTRRMIPLNESATHLMVSGSWDATVKVWNVSVDDDGEAVSITRDPLIELYDADASVVCVSATETEGGIFIAAGCSDGSFIVWNCTNNGVKEVLHKERTKREKGSCSCITWGAADTKSNVLASSGNAVVLIAGFASGKISSYVLHDRNISPVSEITLGSPVRCLAVVDKSSVIVGCADGGLRVIAMERRAFFDSKPKCWKSVNGKNSPSISSLSMCCSYGEETKKKRWCATGADDGSVALYEMQFS